MNNYSQLKYDPKFLSKLLDSSNDMIYVFDKEIKLIYINQAASRALRAPAEQLLGKSQYELFPKTLAQDHANSMLNIFETGKSSRKEETILFPGIEIRIDASLSPLYDEEEKIWAILGVSRDITNKYLIYKKLEASEKQYREFVELAQEGIWAIDKTEMTSFVNPKMSQMLGYTQEEILGKYLSDFMDEQGIALCKENLVRRREGIVEQHEFEFIHKNGERVFVLINTSATTDEKGDYSGSLAFITNITERKVAEQERLNLQAKLFQASKLASLGTLASSVAHEINNPLTIAQMNTDILNEMVNEEAGPMRSKMLLLLEKQNKALSRITDIVKTLKIQSRTDISSNSEINLHTLIAETLDLYAPLFKNSFVTFGLDLKAESPSIISNSDKIQQVIINLITNACDAINDRREKDANNSIQSDPGKITIKTENASEYLIMKVIDNGGGIPDEILPNIFTLFYTTKKPGKGTGLGLSISEEIIKDLNGKIAVETQSGSGTTFTISLPTTRI